MPHQGWATCSAHSRASSRGESRRRSGGPRGRRSRRAPGRGRLANQVGDARTGGESANRDEDSFRDPDTFRVDRRPNPHLGFGIGEHFCLGASLARLELRVIFRELAERLEAVELDGPVERMRSSFLGGVKRMPIRCTLRP